jgi:PDZ domain
MARPVGAISCALILSLLLAKSGSSQQITSQLPKTSTGGQPGTIDPSTTIRPQNADEHALEISRQPGGQPPTHDETVAPRVFKLSKDEASFGPDLRPEPEQYTAGRAPYLGITIAETSECVLGNEEHTLEVLSVRPGSPAAKAGLNANAGFSAPASIASAIFIPIGLAAHALLHRAGMPGYSHDLVIGVNDQRVHDKAELDRELSKLKPGDSAYINIVHPLPSGSHQTLRLFLTVGEWRTEAPLESAGRSMGPATFDSNGNVSYAY